MVYNKVYENTVIDHIIGGKNGGFTSYYRAGYSSDNKSPTNYVATYLHTVASEEATRWFCHSHTKYETNVGIEPRSVQIEYNNNPMTLSLATIPPEFGYHSSALETAFQKASSSQMSLSVELAEVLKTSRTIVSVVKGFLSFIVDAKKSLTSKRHRRRFIRRFSELKTSDVASFWMAFRFGIRPLVYGVEGAIELHNVGIKKGLTFYGKGLSTHSFTSNGYSCKTSVKYRLTYAVTDIHEFVSQQMGITSSDIVSTVWELTPLSWALDYILPIGDYIQSLSRRLKNPGVKFVNMSRSRKSEATFDTSATRSYMVCYGQHESTVSNYAKYKCEHYERNITTIEPFPPFVVPLESLGTYQIADLAALATGILSKKTDRYTRVNRYIRK